MTAQPSMAEVARFRELIAQRLGLDVDESKLGNLAKLLASHCKDNCSGYLGQLPHAPMDQLAKLAVELTVTETYFYRHIDQISAFVEVALRACLQASNGSRPVRILSAGCASGDEAYSLAIAARERAGVAPGMVAIDAIDINPLMLAKAARGHYTTWSLREFPAELKQRWFKPDGDGFTLSDSIRAMVHFWHRNLADSDPAFWHPDAYDIVFCRNVLMYFTPAHMEAAVARIATALTPGGYLFLGHAETLRGVSNDFHLCHTHATFYYQRKTDNEPAPPQPWVAAPPSRRVSALDDTAWVDAIEQAARRIDVLAGAAPAASSQTRYDHTLAQLGGMAAGPAGDTEALLLDAVTLSQSGALAEARSACQRLLALDELNAGAHYVLGLCCESAHDVGGALGHYQSACYLDPGFAMPRVHAGLLARRQGDAAAARHDLDQAQHLLKREDGARLLLFGGGFKREALIALCRAELAALGAYP